MIKRMHLFWASLTAVALGYFAAPTSIFLTPRGYWYDGELIHFYRETPLGAFTAEYSIEIESNSPDSIECSSTGTTFFQVEPGDVVALQPAAWAEPCLEKGVPFTVRAEWHAILFGRLRLAPLDKTFIVDNDPPSSG